MWDLLLTLLPVGCRHRHTSLPFSSASTTGRTSRQEQWDRIAPSDTGPYVVCLDCGKHFDYDWSRMRVVK